MCGIAGVIDTDTSPDERRARVERMCTAMTHRGPDSVGVTVNGGAAVGTRRLAIIDPALGHQPMTSTDRRHVLVFNGAIYNFRELQRELETGGATFRTQCDTEVLLAAWTKWGVACIPRLRGMFAFAVWDAHTEKLSLVRDRSGIKPLYFAQRDGRLVFASEIRALEIGLSESLTIDPDSVALYLGWLAVPAPRTIFRNVWSLRPGEIATFAKGKLELSSWSRSSIRANDESRCATREEFTRELRARLDDSIRAHCLADVPVGAFLSGGLDSSSVVALMSRQTGAQLKTFAIGFQERDWDESNHAAEIARHLGTHHETKIVSADELATDLPRILAAMDQPTGDGINTYLVSQLARAGGVKVALSGLGADELFGGYPSFQQVPAIVRWLRLWQRLPRSGRRVLIQQLRARQSGARKLADILEHGRNVHEVCALQRRVFGSTEIADLLHPEFHGTLEATSWRHPSLAQLEDDFPVDNTDLRSLVSRWESETYMADVLLRDSDVMSMRHSLELRVPFVDQPLMNWLAQQKPEFRFDSARPKSALFQAVRDLLPAQLEHRRKRGFSLPFARWMKRELRPFLEETFSDASVRRSGFLSPSAAQKLWRSYLENSDTRQWSRVWSLAVLIQFANRHQPNTRSDLSAAAAVEGVAPSAPGLPNGADEAAPSSRVNRLLVRQSKRTFLLLAPELFAGDGGISRMLRVYLRALVEIAGQTGCVRVVSLNDQPQGIESADLRSDMFCGCGGDKSLFVRSALQFATDCDELICGHVAQLPVAQLAKTLNPRLRVSLVAHGIEVWRPFTPAENLALQQTNRVFCVSRYTREEMSRWISLPRSRFTVLPNALDPRLDFGAAPVSRPVDPVILSISRLDSGDRYKGIDDLLRALPLVGARVPRATLRIIGRGNDLARLQRLHEDLALGRAVEFLGYCTDEIVANELSCCSVFALPSTREGFGLVFLEAMAHGRPCVGAHAGAVPELITPETGILVQPNNVSALAHGCVDALERNWNHSGIIARAKEFSYSIFKERLSSLVLATSRPVHASPTVTHP